MKCHNCGKDNLDGAKFCQYCGTKLEPVPDTEEKKTEDNEEQQTESKIENTTENTPKNTPGNTTGSGKGFPKLAIIITVAAVIVVGGLTMFIQMQKSNTQSNAETETEAVVTETETVATETEAVVTETETVAIETEAVATETETVAPETEDNNAEAEDAYMSKLAEIKAEADAMGEPPFGSNTVMYMMLDVDADGADEMLVESQATLDENSSYVVSAIYKYNGSTVDCMFSDPAGWESWQSSFWGFYKDAGVIVLHFSHNSTLLNCCYNWDGQTFEEGETIYLDGSEDTTSTLEGMNLGEKTDLLTGWTTYAE